MQPRPADGLRWCWKQAWSVRGSAHAPWWSESGGVVRGSQGVRREPAALCVTITSATIIILVVMT